MGDGASHPGRGRHHQKIKNKTYKFQAFKRIMINKLTTRKKSSYDFQSEEKSNSLSAKFLPLYFQLNLSEG